MPGLLQSPIGLTGAGILAASSPLTPSSQAIGLGLMAGQQAALDLEKRRENAALAELQRQQIQQAMMAKRQEQEFRQRLRQRAPQIASEMVAPGLEGPLAPAQEAQAGLMQFALEADPGVAGRILERQAAMKPGAPQIKTVQQGNDVVTYAIGPGGGDGGNRPRTEMESESAKSTAKSRLAETCTDTTAKPSPVEQRSYRHDESDSIHCQT